MSESLDFRAEMELLLEREGKDALKQWAKILKGGGKIKTRRNCAYCDRPNTFEVEVADVEQQRHIVRLLTENTLPKPKEDPAAPRVGYGADLTQLTDDELELEIARLDAETVASGGEPSFKPSPENIYELAKRIVADYESGKRQEPWTVPCR